MDQSCRIQIQLNFDLISDKQILGGIQLDRDVSDLLLINLQESCTTEHCSSIRTH